MIRKLKEYLVILVLYLMRRLRPSKYETPRYLGALEPQSRLQSLEWRRVELILRKKIANLSQEKRLVASDSLQKFQLQVLKLDNNNEVAGELGPLQYLSGLTGYPMDIIINWLLLIIIFVFDPLAISLVVAANFAFDQAKAKRKYKENLYEEIVEVKEETNIDMKIIQKKMKKVWIL